MMTSRRPVVRIAGIVMMVVLVCTGLSDAQPIPGTGELHGTVTDSTGGVIVAAAVTLRSASGQSWSGTTDGQGRYAFRNLTAGRYTLVVNAPGFVDFTDAVAVQASKASVRNVVLKVSVRVSLEVTESQGLSTDPRKNLSAFVLAGRELEGLPDDPALLLLRILEMAGTTGKPGEVAVYVDGFREYKRLPPKNTIQMVRINSNPFSAEFSQPSTRRVEITTKPGSDTFHGDVRVQARASATDARSPLAETSQQMRYWNGNGYLQGPIGKSLGFLVYGGQWKQDDNAFVNATVLDDAIKAVRPFATTVLTPTTVRSAVVKADLQVAKQTFNVSFARTTDTRQNQGLASGFDLPDHAYDRSSRDDTIHLWWTSVGRSATNDVRVELNRSAAETTARSTTPAVLVLDAFNAGSNQETPSRNSTRGLQASETLTVQRGRHVLKAGALVELTNQQSTDRSGFAGTFVFGGDVERDATGNPLLNADRLPTAISPIENYRRTLLGLPGYAPSQFSITSGSPDVDVEQWNAGWFLLDDWSASKRVALSFGLRQDLQDNITTRLNLAPRGALSWLIDERGKNAIRLGGGIFYSRVDPGITLYVRKLNGIDRRQLVVQRPRFVSVPALDAATAVQPTIYTKSPDLRMPSSRIASIAYERELPWHLFGVVQYLVARGVDQLRLRAITPPVPGAAPGAPVLQFESTGRSSQRELMLGLRGYFSRELTLYGNYTFARKYSDTDGPFSAPGDSLNLSNEYGRAADDTPHQFLGGVTAQLPAGILIDSTISVASGRPFNITTGRDDNGDTLFTDRPGFAQPGDAGAIDTPFGRFNPNPQPGDTRIPRNFGRDPWLVNVNLAVSKTIAKYLTVMIDAENLLNSSRLFGSNGVVTSPVFGIPRKALNPRRLELTIRVTF
jgi:Carboxypeptidase regulatory-like domain